MEAPDLRTRQAFAVTRNRACYRAAPARRPRIWTASPANGSRWLWHAPIAMAALPPMRKQGLKQNASRWRIAYELGMAPALNAGAALVYPLLGAMAAHG